MPRKSDDAGAPPRRGEGPRTDLPPDKDPYYPGYFGTDEEEGAVREQDDREVERETSHDEDAAGGDREIG